MGSIGTREIIILLIVVIVLFGAKRLPDSARSLGRSMRIFKSEIKEMGNDEKKDGPAQDGPAQDGSSKE